MRKRICIGLWIGLGFAMAQVPTPVGPPTAPPSDISQGSSVPHVDDKRFIKDAVLDGMTEVELGKIAVKKASNPQVRDLAQRMVEEFSETNRALLRVASDETVAVAKTIDSKHQARIDRLAKLSGAEFDRAYIQDEIKQRHQDLKEFNGASQGARDPGLKNFATSTLASLEDHQNALKTLAKGIK